MKIIATGTRHQLTSHTLGMVRTALDMLYIWAGNAGERFQVVHGDAPGVDRAVRAWCVRRQAGGGKVDEFRCPAKWALFGKAAGRYRNETMWNEHWQDMDLCLALPAPDSRGTTHCIELAAQHSCPTWIIPVEALSLPKPPRARLIPQIYWNADA